MNRLRGAIVFCLGVASANDAIADSCTKPGSTSAKILNLPVSDENARTALAVALNLGLSPYSFPQVSIAGITAPCKRLDFKASDGIYTLYGVDERDSPPRYAMQEKNTDRIAYLALLPLPAPAVAAVSAAPNLGRYRFKPGQMIYVLAVTEGYQRTFFRFYDAIPDDRTLATDMCAALSGEDKPIGVYNSSFGNTVFYTEEPSKPAHQKCRVIIS
jgi:hypothetical protein